MRSSSGELSKNAYFARKARKIRQAAAFLSSAITIVVRIAKSGLGNGFCFSVSRTKRKADKLLFVLCCERETGRRRKTVDNCFSEAETTPSNERAEPSWRRRKSATMRRWWGTFNSRGIQCGGICPPTLDGKPAQKEKQTSYCLPAFWCGRRELNPYGKTTRPSNVRVCQFRHSRGARYRLYTIQIDLSTPFSKKNKKIFHGIFSLLTTPFFCVIMQTVEQPFNRFWRKNEARSEYFANLRA